MAIVQSSLAQDEILSRQERAVIRGVYRASQLAEAMNALDKVIVVQKSTETEPKGNVQHLTENADKVRAYFAKAIRDAIESIKVPASSSVAKGPKVQEQT